MGDVAPVVHATSSAKKKEEKARKKDQKAWENVIKSVTDLPDSEKINVIHEKYVSLYNDSRRTTSNYLALEKKYTLLQKERDQLRTDLNKAILAKANLESLCRELQKQNKTIKDENMTRVKEEEEKRREVATNFTERLNSLSSMMDENKDKSVRLREENMNMTLKLTDLYNKFQERENHLAEVNRQLDTQKELFDSKIKKIELEYKADRKVWEEESAALLSDLIKSNEANRLLEENIKSMQANLDVYKNQYCDFEQTMTRSNEVFKTFHGEINKLQKLNTALEKEKCEYVAKWKSCHNTVVEISEKNQQLSKTLEMKDKKAATLEKLCRQLQAERLILQKQLQEKTDGTENISLNDFSAGDSTCNLQENRSEMEEKQTQTGFHSSESEESVSSVAPLEQKAATSAPKIERKFSSQCSSVSSSATIESSGTPDYGSIDLTIGEIDVKEVKSLPTTRKEHEKLMESALIHKPSSSSSDICGDLSGEGVPLYKPVGVIDVPTQGGHCNIVKESEGSTNILEKIGAGDQELVDQDPPSEGTITLHPAPGKTELQE